MYHSNAGTKQFADINLLHKRLVHAGENVLKMLSKHSKDILEIHGSLLPCHLCHMGEAKKKSFQSMFEPTGEPGEGIDSDMAETLPKSIDGRQ